MRSPSTVADFGFSQTPSLYVFGAVWAGRTVDKLHCLLMSSAYKSNQIASCNCVRAAALPSEGAAAAAESI
jgi:hypothetical protein